MFNSQSEQFDPLVATSPKRLPQCRSYWSDTIDIGAATSSLTKSVHTDVAIIGGGYTGLLTAYYLAKHHQVDVCVLEANRVGFGASARNAGFVLKGSGRLGYSQMAKRWDLDTAKGIYSEFSEAVSRVKRLIEEHHIDCEPQSKGYLKIAHNAKAMAQLEGSANFIGKYLGDDAQVLSLSQLKADYMDHKQAFGALRINDGFGINPLKLLMGYKTMVERQGVPVFEQTCVESWIEENGIHRLISTSGEVIANKVVTLGNGYTPKRLNSAVDSRFLPILSNIVVTQPLSTQELAASGLNTREVVMDTRVLKYYYRLLPDNRLLFGGRGAIFGRDANKPIYQQRLKFALTQCFPALKNKGIDYNWNGWIAATLDDVPHVYLKNGIGYSLGYCGVGVSFSAQAAFRLAQQIVGKPVPQLPLYNTPAPKFPAAGLRRLGQWSYYHYGWLKDRYF
ncbi:MULTISPECIES: FAD-binding oxidoreductase [unclassified Shewanella]|uniref:NAD(P)/FAD-dependent oxidoreductase n=1 Tax=unclassified Shewanella TaxID=196818 RepID=UPI001BC757EC|nr:MULTISPECIES: FAD-binding oxidoreductase [unclassified Shewanella]GIU10630.1 FAD-dependent oxidoreductase [Shewanella sp. MBTL60-112-B1]GIU40297.1 FAD-dependent oxidoreductase [Shewanella sp. MBTL60-112-B2]